MSNKIYGAINLIGGAAGALDAIDGAILNIDDMAVVFSASDDKFYVYRLKTSSDIESSPNIITPDTNSSNKRWILLTAGFTGSQGIAGQDGASNTKWFDGNGVPSNAIGSLNDYYWNKDNRDVYKRALDINIKYYTSLNPNDKGGGLILSNSNLTVTNSNTPTNSVRSILSLTSGKWYFEITVNDIGAGMIIGMSTTSLIVDANDFPGYNSSLTGIGYHSGGTFYKNGSIGVGSSYTTGDVIGIAIDLINSNIWFSKNGIPANGGNPYSFSFNSSLYPTVSLGASPAQATFNFGSTSFSGTVPSGFTSGYLSYGSSWTLIGNLGVGEKGAQGNQWLSGTSDPDINIGSQNDFFFNAANKKMFKKDNLLANSPIPLVESNFSLSLTPSLYTFAKAIDGDINTYVRYYLFNTNLTIIFDSKEISTKIKKISVNYLSTVSQSISGMLASVDNINWINILSVYNLSWIDFTPPDYAYIDLTSVAEQYRYYKFSVGSSYPSGAEYIDIYDFKIYSTDSNYQWRELCQLT